MTLKQTPEEIVVVKQTPAEKQFKVWHRDSDPMTARTFAEATPERAAEQYARADYRERQWPPDPADPTAYFARDERLGVTWEVDVAIVHEPAFVADRAREVPLLPAVHVLWGSQVLCEEPRLLAALPGSWPEGQRWISLREFAGPVEVPASRCEKCWARAADVANSLRKIEALL